MNPQIQVCDAFGVHMQWPDEGEPPVSFAPELWDGLYFVTCPHCNGKRVADGKVCAVCDGIGDVPDNFADAYRPKDV